MHSVLLQPDREELDRLTAQLWEMGTAGILEEGDCLRAFFEDNVDTSSLSYVAGVSIKEIRAEPEASAYAFAQEDWEPLLVGSRFFIAPSWVTTPAPEGRLRLTVDSLSAFGTGRHETTQLMLEYLETLIQGGETVVDIGCGSGILSRAAGLLGAAHVVGCDIDELAVNSARRELGISAFLGSADALRSHSADVLLVNISARVIDTLAGELKRIAKPASRVLVTGFLRGREPESFAALELRQQGDWLCALGTRESFRVPEARPGAVTRHAAQWW